MAGGYSYFGFSRLENISIGQVTFYFDVSLIVSLRPLTRDALFSYVRDIKRGSV